MEERERGREGEREREKERELLIIHFTKFCFHTYLRNHVLLINVGQRFLFCAFVCVSIVCVCEFLCDLAEE